ncbi:MAG: helix-turn-helix transcriptional regulator [Burkholderiales bacterium]|nr:helix-turn-helix transcriptional regulator [Burkholderiales bacterium]
MEVWQLRLQASLAEHALDALQYPVMVMDEQAHVLLANTAANRWLSENGEVYLRSSRLRASHLELEQRLWRMINSATRGEGAVRTGGFVAVRRKLSAQNGASKPFSVRVIPLRPDARLAVNWQRPLALLLVADPEASAPLEPLALQTLFGLTPAEARLAVSLAEGKNLEEIAERAHVSLNTAKTQLRLAFEKTGTHRQAELVKLVLSHPRVDGELTSIVVYEMPWAC